MLCLHGLIPFYDQHVNLFVKTDTRKQSEGYIRILYAIGLGNTVGSIVM